MSTFEQQILRSLRRITRASDLYSRQLAARFGLTGPQLVSLRALEKGGPCTPSALAKAVDLSQATMTGIVDRLEAAGLLRRTRDHVDRRRITLSLTPAGQSLLLRAPSALQDNLLDKLGRLSVDEQEVISNTLETVVSMMGAEALETTLEPPLEPTLEPTLEPSGIPQSTLPAAPDLATDPAKEND